MCGGGPTVGFSRRLELPDAAERSFLVRPNASLAACQLSYLGSLTPDTC